ncbi:MAG: DUF637 domain-containing protein [Arcobacter sp.]|uniref:DUF637 domain-containing protein n=1 Tax=Arcobacter sp. TaxID=1872629 RepID=UPI003B00039E
MSVNLFLLTKKETLTIKEATKQEFFDLKHEVKGGFFGGKLKLAQTKDTKTIVSSILKANNVNITSKDTNLIASQIIANQAQITADILTLMSKKDVDYESYFEDSSGFMTKTITSKGHVKEKVVEAKIQTDKLIFNNKDITNELKVDNLVKTLSSQYDLSIDQINLIKQIATSKEWDVSTTSLTGVGQLIVAVIVAVCTAGAGAALMGVQAAATTATTAAATAAATGTAAAAATATAAASALTTATIQAAVVQSVVTGVTTQLVTSAITGNSFKLNSKALVLGAISAGVMSYASSMIDVSKMGLTGTAQKIAQTTVNTTVKTGIQSAVYGTDFKDSLVSNLAMAGSDLIAQEAFNEVGNTSMNKYLGEENKSLKDGGLTKTLLHTATGAGIAAINGDDILAGALSAGAREALSPLTANSSREGQLFISQLTGILVGGLVDGDAGAKSGMEIATAGELYNRQLHQDEIKFIEEKSKDYAKKIYNTDNPTDKQILKSQQILYTAGKYYNDKSTKAWEDAKLKEVGLTYTKEDLQNAFEYLQVNSNGLTFTDQYKGIVTSQPQQYFTSTEEQYKDSSWIPDNTIGMKDISLSTLPIGKFGLTGGVSKGISSTALEVGTVGKVVEKDITVNVTKSIDNVKIQKIISIPKGQRPNPSTYMSKVQMESQLEKFNDGAVRFTTESNFNKYGIAQSDGTSFIMTKQQADLLLINAKGNSSIVEKELGLPSGFLETNKIVRIDIPQPKELNIRIPSGNEAGVNNLWIPGGKLPSGKLEAVIDVGNISKSQYNTTIIEFKE